MADNRFYATGRRKEAAARVWITPGTGTITINKRNVDAYFMRPTLEMVLKQPLEAVEALGKWDVWATVAGGGLSGQAGAVKHGLARALVAANAENRAALKKGAIQGWKDEH